MSAITNKWNDGSEDSINIESSSFIGNQTLTISSPVQIATVKRSIALIGKCANDATKTVTLTVEQLASAYTYEFALAASNTTLAAGGGEANITATLKTFRNGGLVNTESVTPVLSGEAEGFTISGTKVTAANRAKVVGADRSIIVTGTFSGTFDKQTVKATIVIKQAANAITYAVPVVKLAYDDIPAAGGSVTPKTATATQGLTYTSGATDSISVTSLAYSGEGVDTKTGSVSAATRGTTVGERKSITEVTLTATANNKSGTAKVTVYQQANEATTITYGVPTVNLTVGDIPAKGGEIASGTVTYSQSATQNYTSGSTSALAAVTTGGTVTYSTKVSATSLGTTEKVRTKIGTLTATVTLNSKSGSKTVDVYQQANTATYGNVTITGGTVADIPAKGGEVASASGLTTAQTITYTSTATKAGTVTVAWSTKVTAASLGTTIKDRTKVGTLTATATGQGSKSATKAFDVYQAANGKTTITYGKPSVTVTCSDVPAKGGSVTSGNCTYSQSQTQNYTSGATGALSAITSGGKVTWSGGASSIASLGTTVKVRTVVGTALTATVILNGQTGTGSCTVYQQANNATYGDLVGGSATTSLIPASGGTSTITITNATQTVSFTSGASRAGTVTNSKTTDVKADSLGTTVKAQTKVGTVTVTFTGEGSKTKSISVDVNQAENKVINANNSPHITAYGVPTVSIGDGLTAAGGSATVTYGVNNTETYNELYSSGATSANKTRSKAGTATIKMTTNGNSRFTLTDAKITHSSMTTNVATDTVTITATNSGDITKTATATKSIENKLTSTTYGDITVGTFTYPQVPASGSAVNPTVAYSQATTQNFTSGSTKAGSAVTSGGTLAYVKIDGSLTVATNGSVTAPSRGTSVGDAKPVGNVKVTVTLNSKTRIKTVTVTQQANERTTSGTTGGVTTYGNVTAGTITNATIPASGGTKTATAGKGKQTWEKSAVITNYKYTSGSTSSAETTAKSSGTNDVNPSVASIEATASSLGTTVKEKATIKSQAVTWTANGKSASGTMYIYQEANAITKYNYGTWTITISANPTTISRDGGTSKITANCTRSKTPVYTSGATGTAGSESATPTLTCSGTGFSLEGTTITATKNTGGARSCTVTATYSGADSKSCTISQEAGLDGIGYMQIEGDGISHPKFRVG